MKEKLLRLLSPPLAALLVLSTISWSVEKHLCMGRVMDIAFFHQTDGCGMEEAMVLMGKTASDMGCCGNESFTLEGQDDLQQSWEELDVDAQQFLVAFAYSFLEILSQSMGEDVPKTIYPPPLLVQDLNILHDVFLI